MIFMIGGSGSGKSAFAEKRAEELHRETAVEAPLYYLATMQVWGPEERARVEKHRRQREGMGFVTLECSRGIERAESKIVPGSVALLECVSNLTANEMFREEETLNGQEAALENPQALADRLFDGLLRIDSLTKEFLVVGNSVFSDGVSYDETTAAYLKTIGRLQQKIMEEASEAWEVVAGIPLRLK